MDEISRNGKLAPKCRVEFALQKLHQDNYPLAARRSAFCGRKFWTTDKKVCDEASRLSGIPIPTPTTSPLHPLWPPDKNRKDPFRSI